jgi:hypothetical protein
MLKTDEMTATMVITIKPNDGRARRTAGAQGRRRA